MLSQRGVNAAHRQRDSRTSGGSRGNNRSALAVRVELAEGVEHKQIGGGSGRGLRLLMSPDGSDSARRRFTDQAQLPLDARARGHQLCD